MSYVRADEILPEDLIKAIQRYVSGRSIYIPCREKKCWGSQTKTRQYYHNRNAEICRRHISGVSVKADEYALSEKSIQRILRASARADGRRPMSAGTLRVYHRCAGCGGKREFINSGRFRVNANGNLLDVWLIFRCKKCKHTWNLAIYERVKLSRLAPGEYERFLENDPALARKYGNDKCFLKRNNAEFHL